MVLSEGPLKDARPSGGGLVEFDCKFANIEDRDVPPPGEEVKTLEFPNSLYAPP